MKYVVAVKWSNPWQNDNDGTQLISVRARVTHPRHVEPLQACKLCVRSPTFITTPPIILDSQATLQFPSSQDCTAVLPIALKTVYCRKSTLITFSPISLGFAICLPMRAAHLLPTVGPRRMWEELLRPGVKDRDWNRTRQTMTTEMHIRETTWSQCEVG